MEADRNIPIPVVDLHGYQMVYDGPGVLWETSYVDAETRTKLPLAKKKIKNLAKIHDICAV